MDGQLPSGSSISFPIDGTIVPASDLGSEPADPADLREDLIEELIELEVNLKKMTMTITISSSVSLMTRDLHKA